MNGLTDGRPGIISVEVQDDTSPDRLSELERFAAIGRLSASLLHEINNPLTAAMLWLEQCSARKSPHIRHVRNNIHLLQRYVEAARQQIRCGGQCQEFELEPELAQVRSILRPLAKRRGINLRFVSAKGLRLYGDPVKFQQIVANLVRNAIDAYDSCPPERRHRPVRLIAGSSLSGLRIIVSDRGCGIDKEQMPQLFQPFYSTKSSSGNGLGIGLFAVKRSIEKDFKGTITVRSSRRKGTSFTVKLPSIPDL